MREHLPHRQLHDRTSPKSGTTTYILHLGGCDRGHGRWVHSLARLPKPRSLVSTATHSDAGTHDVEEHLQPIPESARTHSVSGQFWIWCGANIAPINWVLGALGINLGLGLRDTLVVLTLGNLIGMALFGFFVLMGQKTGVTGLVLSRAAFGRRGNYLPATIQAALAIGWCAVNTWIILDLVMALLGEIGAVDPTAPNYAPKIIVATLIMTAQVVISWLGYRA